MASSLTPRLTIKQINSPDVDLDKLRLTLDVYSRAANTRLRALEKAGMTSSPAYKAAKDFARDNRQFMSVGRFKESKGKFKFSTKLKGRSREDIQEELTKLHTFLFEAKTSTVKGAKERLDKIYEGQKVLKKDKSEKWAEYFQGMSKDDFEDFWDLTNIKTLVDAFGSKQAIQIIEAAYSNSNIGHDLVLLDKAIQDLTDRLKTSLYEMTATSIKRRLKAYKPTGSVT